MEPANRPTTATSDMLNRICKRLDKASGRLTSRICLASGPSIMVLDFEVVLMMDGFCSCFNCDCTVGAGHARPSRVRQMGSCGKAAVHTCAVCLSVCRGRRPRRPAGGYAIRPCNFPLHRVIRKNRVILPQNDPARCAGLVHVNDALVARPAEAQTDVVLVLHKVAVHKHIYIL